MDRSEYTFEHSGLLYKHSVTEAPPCDSFYMHSHNLFELLYFISGDATCMIEDRKYKLKRGDLVLIRPSEYHYIQIDSSQRYERYDLLFSGDVVLSGIPMPPADIEVVNLFSDPVADGIFKHMDYFSGQLDKNGLAEMMKLLLRQLFFCIGIDVKKTESTDLSVTNPLLSKALGYINDNLFSVKDVGEVAAAMFVSESYLFRLFKNELKQSPKKYITNKRLLASQNMIAAGESPTAVYEKCGFNDYTAFYRGYNALFGYPPSREMKNAERRMQNEAQPFVSATEIKSI